MPLYSPTVAPAAWFPADHGIVSWAYDPQGMINNSSTVNGTLYLVGLQVRAAATISTLYVTVQTAAITPTAGQNFLGLYNSAGTLLSSGSADTAFAATGLRSVTLGAAQSVTAGTYWVGILGNAGTAVFLTRNSGSASAANVGLSTAGQRFCVNGTGLTALPSSVTPASNTQTGAITFWAAAA